MHPDRPAATGEPRLASIASWAVLVASFGLSAATWVALARLAGFTGNFLAVKLAWLMPVAIDGYVVVALVLWMSPVPAKVARFARVNTYAAASVGVVAQSAFHSLSVWAVTHEEWRAALAAVVGALPPAVAALAVHMRALIRREALRRPSSDAVADSRPDMSVDTAPVTKADLAVTEAVTPADMTAAIEADMAPVIAGRTLTVVPAMTADTEADTPPATRRSSGRTRRPATTAAAVAALRRRQPDITTAEMAKRLKKSERTIRRALAETTDATDQEDVRCPA